MKSKLLIITPLWVCLIILGCKPSLKPGTLTEIKFINTSINGSSDSSLYLLTYEKGQLSKVETYPNGKNEDVATFKYSNGKVSQGGYIPLEWHLDNLGRAIKAVDKEQKRHFECFYNNDGYLERIEYFDDTNNAITLAQHYHYSNGNLLEVVAYEQGTPKQLCSFQYYTDKRNTDVFNPVITLLYAKKLVANPIISYNTYSYPKDFFGKHSANLIKSIIVPNDGIRSEWLTSFTYQLSGSGRVEQKSIINNPYSNTLKNEKQILYTYYGKEELKDNVGHNEIKSVQNERVMTLNEIKLALLDARLEKADILLGDPDKHGRLNINAGLNYEVYFDKVKDGSNIKHLVLVIEINNSDYKLSRIRGIKAIADGDDFNWGWREFIVSRNRLSSSNADFTVE